MHLRSARRPGLLHPPLNRTYSDEVLADAPLVYWRMNETTPGSGSQTLVDASGNGNSATANATSYRQSALAPGLGPSMYFDGSSGHNAQWSPGFLFPHNGSPTEAPWAIEVITQPVSLRNGAPNALWQIGAGGGSDGNMSLRTSDSGKRPGEIELTGASVDVTDSQYDLVAGSTAHMLVEWDGSLGTIYKNAVVIATFTSGGGRIDANAFLFPYNYDGRQMNGYMSDMAIYPHALGQARVSAHVAAMHLPAPVPGSFSHSSAGSGSMPYTHTLPAVASGQLLVLATQNDRNKHLTTPAGWTRVPGQQSSGYVTLVVFTKISDGTETNVVITDAAPDGTVSAVVNSYNGMTLRGYASKIQNNSAPLVAPPVYLATGDEAVYASAGQTGGGGTTIGTQGADITTRNHQLAGTTDLALGDALINVGSPGMTPTETSSGASDTYAGITLAIGPARASTVVANTNHTGNITLVNDGDSGEEVITDLSCTGLTVGKATTVAIDLWESMNHSGSVKGSIARIYDGDHTGTLLASYNFPDVGDDSGGHASEWSVAVNYVAATTQVTTTIQITHSNCTIYSDTRNLMVTQ